MKINVIWLVLSCVSCRVVAAPALVGIINKSKNFEIWVGKPGTSGAFVVQASQSYYPKKLVSLPDTSNNDSGHKFDRSRELFIKRVKPIKDGDPLYNEYLVKIAQTGKGGNHLLVTAQAQAGQDQRSAETYVTNAVNGANIQGVPPSPWQGVIIAFTDKAVSDASRELPFAFALSAWASNRDTWVGDETHFLKTNKNVEKTVTFKDKNGKVKYLDIIQGQQALGGGVVPRPKCAHFVHIYNNTSRTLDLQRSIGKGQGDSILIPPYSVLPYIMEWVPVRTSKLEGIDESAKPVIRIALVRSSTLTDLLLADESILEGAAGQEAVAEVGDVDDILQNMGLFTTDSAAEILGTPDIKQLMKPAGATKWNMSGIVYKIFADDDKKLYIYSRDTRDENAADQLVQSVTPTYIDYPRPGYFELIVTESGDAKNPVKFELINMKTIVKPFISQ